MKRHDFWIGLFVVISVGMIVGFTIYLRTSRVPEYPLYVTFDEMPGISSGSEVRMRGFPIGKVRTTTFNPSPEQGKPYILIELAIEEQYPVFEGSFVEVQTSLIGQAHLSINTESAGVQAIEPGTWLRGTMSNDLSRAMERLPEMFDKITYMSRRIGDVEWRRNIHSIGDNVKKIRVGWDGMHHRLSSTLMHTDSVLSETKLLIAGISENVDTNLTTSNALLGDMRETVKGTNEQLIVTLKELNTSLGHVSGFMQNLDTLTTEKRDEIGQILQNLNAATTSLSDLLKHPLKTFTGGIK